MKYLFLLFSLVPSLLWSQYYFDFEFDTVANAEVCGSDLVEQVPESRWQCVTEGAISGASSLHHSFDNPASGCDYFIFSLDPIKSSDSLIISFKLRHGYPPSSANNWQLAFLTDFSYGQITGGLLLGVNYSGSDDLVKLWECQNGDCHVICTTILNYQESIGIDSTPEFSLVWANNGTLRISYKGDPMDVDYLQIGSCKLESLPEGRKLVVRYEYSSSQDRNLWIDDIKLEGHFVRDTIAPYVTEVNVLDGWHMEILFSEPVVFPGSESFRMTGPAIGSMRPDSLYVIPHGVVLKFPQTIPNREEHQLEVTGICDADANCLPDTLINGLRNEAVWGDVVFNELMADPTPAVLLAEEEYIEFYNNSAYFLDLTGWHITIGDRSHNINEIHVKSGLSEDINSLLAPYSYGVMTGVSLPNEGAMLALYNEKGTLIHAAHYCTPWDGQDWKKEGGWSLESPDPDLACTISDLWEFSSHSDGGTPGSINSNDTEVKDKQPPVFLYSGYGYDNGNVGGNGIGNEEGDEDGDPPELIVLHFSEPVVLPSEDEGIFKILPGNLYADSVVSGNLLSDQLNVWFKAGIQEQTDIKIHIPALSDCAQNLSSKTETSLGKVSEVRFGSVLINEIMFHPVDGAPEFVELYVPGDEFYDLQDLALDFNNDETSPDSPVALSDHSRILSPGQFLVITKNVPHFMDFYNLNITGQWIGLSKMEVLNNSGGSIFLTDRNGSVVDVVYYSNEMHMELLVNTQGISLERISIERSGSNPDNWHSAASIEGYFTPGRKNSQSLKESEFNDLLNVEPTVFSPDNDGYQDLLVISISPGAQGWVASLWITDLMGRQVKSLANNHLTGPSVTYTWNGNMENGQMADEGIYVIHVRGYHADSEEVWNKKKAIGLIYR